MKVKVSSSYQTADVFVKQGGAYRSAETYVKQGGAYKLVGLGPIQDTGWVSGEDAENMSGTGTTFTNPSNVVGPGEADVSLFGGFKSRYLRVYSLTSLQGTTVDEVLGIEMRLNGHTDLWPDGDWVNARLYDNTTVLATKALIQNLPSTAGTVTIGADNDLWGGNEADIRSAINGGTIAFGFRFENTGSSSGRCYADYADIRITYR